MCLVLLAAGDTTLNCTIQGLWPGEDLDPIFTVYSCAILSKLLISLSFAFVFCKMGVTPHGVATTKWELKEIIYTNDLHQQPGTE